MNEFFSPIRIFLHFLHLVMDLSFLPSSFHLFSLSCPLSPQSHSERGTRNRRNSLEKWRSKPLLLSSPLAVNVVCLSSTSCGSQNGSIIMHFIHGIFASYISSILVLSLSLFLSRFFLINRLDSLHLNPVSKASIFFTHLSFHWHFSNGRSHRYRRIMRHELIFLIHELYWKEMWMH